MVEKLRAARFAQGLGRAVRQAQPLLVQLALAAAAALLAGTALMGGLAPLGLALVCGVPAAGLPAAAAGAVAGTVMRLPSLFCARYLAALLAAAAVRLLLARKKHRGGDTVPAAAAGGAALVAAQVFASARLGEGALAPATALAEALLAGGMAVMFALALPPLAAGRRLAALPASVQAAGALCASALLLGLWRIRLAGLTLGQLVFGALALWLAAADSGQTAVLGLTMTLAAALGGVQNEFAALGLAAAALAACAFRGRGRPAMAGCFCGAAFLGLFGAPQPLAGLWYLAGAGASALLFLLLPPPAVKSAPRREGELTGRVSARLWALSEALCAVGTTVDEVCRRMPPAPLSLNALYDRAAAGPCAACKNRMNCWITHCSDTMNGLSDARALLADGGQLTADKLPQPLASLCCAPAVLAGALNECGREVAAQRAAAARTAALRSALTGQYTAMADALGRVAEELFAETAADSRRARQVGELFCALGLPPLEVSAAQTRDGRCRVSVALGAVALSPEELTLLAGEVSACCGRQLCCVRQSAPAASIRLEFTEAPPLTAEFAAASSAAAGGVSADAVRSFCDARGRAHLILCDGMGTGKAAAVDGELAASLSRRLIDAGFEGDDAARLVNVALTLKGEDAGAALDLLTVDLYTGRCDLFKAGAAPTYVLKKGQAAALSAETLPVGLMGGVVGRSVRTVLGPGAAAVMVSDGAVAAGDDWLKAELQRLAAAPPQQLAEELLAGALRRAGGRRDDITVAVLRLSRRRGGAPV